MSDFEPGDDFCNFLIDIGFGKNCDKDVRDFWKKTIKGNYQGGKRRSSSPLSSSSLVAQSLKVETPKTKDQAD